MPETKLMEEVPAVPPENLQFRLTEDITLEFDNKNFIIHKDKFVGSGGESLVYIATRQQDGEEAVAKLYTHFANNDNHKEDRKAVLDFLSQDGAKDYKRNHLLPLYAAGEYQLEGPIPIVIPIDIMPKCTPICTEIKDRNENRLEEELKSKVIPGILAALNLMHTNGLVHRDIKPENIYYFNDVVVLGDFGISSRINERPDNQVAGNTTVHRGTVGYTAPEVSRSYYTPKSDYYSLGCTIATLLNGGQPVYYGYDVEGDINQAIDEKGLTIPKNCDESFQILVDALTLNVPKNRAGYKDVCEWLKDPKKFADNWRNRISNTGNFVYKYEGKTYTSKEDLTEAFLNNWDYARDYFFENTYNRFLHYLTSTGQACVDYANKILEERRIAVESKSAFDKDLGFAKFLHYFNLDENNECPIYWCGYQFGKLSDIPLQTNEEGAPKKPYADDPFIHLLKSKFLSWKLDNVPDKEKDSIKEQKAAIEIIEELSSKHPVFAYYYLMYCLAPEGTFEIETETVDKIFNDIVPLEATVFSSRKKIEKFLHDDNMLARIASMGYKKEVLILKEAVKDENNKKIENINCFYRLFYSICDNKKHVVEHYYKYGPYAHLVWIQEHLEEYYSFNTDRGNEIKRFIMEDIISNPRSIDELIKISPFLNLHVSRLINAFQNDIALALTGINDKNDITAKSVDSYFVPDNYNNYVPLGYLREIKAFEGSLDEDEEDYEFDKNDVQDDEKTASQKVGVKAVSRAPSYSLVINSINGSPNIAQIIKYYTGMQDKQISILLSYLPCTIDCELDEDVMKEFVNELQNAGAEAEYFLR